MYSVSAQGIDEHMINVHYYYYYYLHMGQTWPSGLPSLIQAFMWVVLTGTGD